MNIAETSYEALTEIVAVEGIAGTIGGLAEFIEKEVELGENADSAWARKMLGIATALRVQAIAAATAHVSLVNGGE